MPFVQHWLERKQLSEGVNHYIRRRENTMLCSEKTDMMNGSYAQNTINLPFLPMSAIHYKGWLNDIFTSNDCIVVCSKIHQGFYSLRGRRYYHKIWRSFEAARFGFILFQSHWNLTGTSAAALPRCLSISERYSHENNPISRLQDFMRSCGKTSVLLVSRGPEISLHNI